MPVTSTSTEDIRLALVGLAPQLQSVEKAMARLSRVTVAVVADDDTARDRLFPSLADNFDAVIVRSPSSQRLSWVQQAFHSKKHVYVESPLSHDPPALGELDRQFASAGLVLMVAQPQRYLPAVQALKSALDSGKLGAPGLLRLHRWEAATPNDAASSLQPDLDLTRWFFDALPLTIYATGSGDGTYRQIHLGFPKGGMALVDHTASLRGKSDYFSMSLIGSTGAAYADDHHNQQLLFQGGDAPAALRTGQGDAALVNSLREFVTGIANKATIDNSLERDAASIAAAANLSFEHRRPVHWKEGRYELA